MHEGATWISQKRRITTDCLSPKLREVVSLVCVEAHLNILKFMNEIEIEILPDTGLSKE